MRELLEILGFLPDRISSDIEKMILQMFNCLLLDKENKMITVNNLASFMWAVLKLNPLVHTP